MFEDVNFMAYTSLTIDLGKLKIFFWLGMVCHMVSKYRYNSCGIYQYNNLKSSAAIYGTVY